MGNAKVNIGSITMPAGEYYVGDPCYAVDDHDRWMKWLEDADYMSNPRYLLADLDGQPALGIGTAFGDGTYLGSDGNEYGVDAGLLGVVPVEVAEDNALHAMQRVTFDQPFECSYDEGTINLGHIQIDTDV